MAKPGATVSKPGTKPTTKPPFGKPKANEEYEVDLTNVQSGFQIEAGTYPGKCVSVVHKQNKEKTAMMFEWTFAITGKQYGGKEFKMWTSLKEEALWKLAQTLEAMGLPGQGNKVKFTQAQVINCPVLMVIVDDTWKENPISRLDSVQLAETALALFRKAKPTSQKTEASKAQEPPKNQSKAKTEEPPVEETAEEAVEYADPEDYGLTAEQWDDEAHRLATEDGLTLDEINIQIGERPEAPF